MRRRNLAFVDLCTESRLSMLRQSRELSILELSSGRYMTFCRLCSLQQWPWLVYVFSWQMGFIQHALGQSRQAASSTANVRG